MLFKDFISNTCLLHRFVLFKRNESPFNKLGILFIMDFPLY
jgi:hypothetical protein